MPSAGRLGLLHQSAPDALKQLSWTNDESIDLLWALSRAPNADLALRSIVRLYEALGCDGAAELDHALRTDRTVRGRLFGLLGSSTAFGDHLAANPDAWRLLQNKDELPTLSDMTTVMLAVVDAVPERGYAPDDRMYRAMRNGPSVIPDMRVTYRNFVMQLAARDMADTVENEPSIPLRVAGAYLSDLADAAITTALAVAVGSVMGASAATAETPTQYGKPLNNHLGVIAMGKCGARELNYVSDVDVVFVAEPADGLASRIAGEMMRISSLAFFEIDAALRPEGKQGALTRSLESHITYYKRWAKTWEFQAQLKARPLCGDMALATEYCDSLAPMVWEASERDDFVADVQAMRRRVEELLPPELKERELKLGRGGLRDVEFAVQLLQMVHGRADNTLRVPATLDALSALSDGGYIGRDDAANFAASYEFLRLLEHRLQLQRLSRTHTLPPADDDEEMRWLARAAHIRPDGDHDALGMLKIEIKRQAQRVRRLHQKLFYRPLLDAVLRFETDELRLSDESAARRLGALGYNNPTHALNHLKALVGQGKTVARRNRVQQVILPTLLEFLSQTPDPDAGLLHYRRLVEECEREEWLLRLLRDDGLVAERLMNILGTSPYVSELLIRSPEVIRQLANGPQGPKLTAIEPEAVANGLIAAAHRTGDVERAISIARGIRRAELARVSAADLLGLLDVPQVCKALSSVWAAVLNAALDAIVASRSGQPLAKIAIIGMGRLGGMELGYGSDADVLFVIDPTDGVDEAAAAKWATSIADELRKRLGATSIDPPLEVDANLRPEGRNGPLVRTLHAYDTYYKQWAQPWEVQALLRAHQVAGDQELGLRFLWMIDDIRYPKGGISPETVREIRRIKARVDAERLPRGADPTMHTKLGRGGLADIEWSVQLMQLRYAHRYLPLHNTSTLQTLDVLGATELLSESDVAVLREAWITATKTRNALVLVKGKATDQLPGSGPQLRAVAYAAGWSNDDPMAFLDHYLRVTRRARRVVSRVFGA